MGVSAADGSRMGIPLFAPGQQLSFRLATFGERWTGLVGRESKQPAPSPALGLLGPNAFGLHDMHGNVSGNGVTIRTQGKSYQQAA